MEPFVHVAEVLVGNVGINLSRGDVGVAQHALDATQIGTIHKQIGREAVTHSVR